MKTALKESLVEKVNYIKILLVSVASAVIVDITPTTFTSLDLERKLDQLYYKAIDGFLMVITNTGDLIYISDNVVTHLGVTQVSRNGDRDGQLTCCNIFQQRNKIPLITLNAYN